MSLPIFTLSNNISFDDFISQYRESIRKTYFTKFYKSIESVNGNKVVEETHINDKDLIKWYSVIDPLFSHLQLDKYTKNLICIYCEVLSCYKKSFSMMDVSIENELKQLVEKILPTTRSKIIDKYYNYKTGMTEYLLEDGNYVPINESVGRAQIIITMDMLPKQLLSIVDIQEYRNQQISKII